MRRLRKTIPAVERLLLQSKLKAKTRWPGLISVHRSLTVRIRWRRTALLLNIHAFKKTISIVYVFYRYPIRVVFSSAGEIKQSFSKISTTKSNFRSAIEYLKKKSFPYFLFRFAYANDLYLISPNIPRSIGSREFENSFFSLDFLFSHFIALKHSNV